MRRSQKSQSPVFPVEEIVETDTVSLVLVKVAVILLGETQVGTYPRHRVES